MLLCVPGVISVQYIYFLTPLLKRDSLKNPVKDFFSFWLLQRWTTLAHYFLKIKSFEACCVSVHTLTADAKQLVCITGQKQNICYDITDLTQHRFLKRFSANNTSVGDKERNRWSFCYSTETQLLITRNAQKQIYRSPDNSVFLFF